MMTGQVFVPLAEADLTATADWNGSQIIARFEGAADTRLMEKIEEFLHTLHREALKANTAMIVVDLQRLEFMNSSCFKAFVGWIGTLEERPDSGTYTIAFVYDVKQHWQRRSLGALVSLGGDRVRLETSIPMI